MADKINLIHHINAAGASYSIAPSASATATLESTDTWVLNQTFSDFTSGMIIAVEFEGSKTNTTEQAYLKVPELRNKHQILPQKATWEDGDVLWLQYEDSKTGRNTCWKVVGNGNGTNPVFNPSLKAGNNIDLTTEENDTTISVTTFSTENDIEQLFKNTPLDFENTGTTSNSNVMPTIRFVGANQTYNATTDQYTYPDNPLKFTVQVVSGFVYPGDVIQLCKKTLKVNKWSATTKTRRYRSRSYFNYVCQKAYNPGDYIAFTYKPDTSRDELIKSTTNGTSENIQYIRIARYFDEEGKKQDSSDSAIKGIFSNEASFTVKYGEEYSSPNIRIH